MSSGEAAVGKGIFYETVQAENIFSWRLKIVPEKSPAVTVRGRMTEAKQMLDPTLNLG